MSVLEHFPIRLTQNLAFFVERPLQTHSSYRRKPVSITRSKWERIIFRICYGCAAWCWTPFFNGVTILLKHPLVSCLRPVSPKLRSSVGGRQASIFFVETLQWIPAFAGMTPVLLILALPLPAHAGCEEIIIRVHGNSLAPLAENGAEIEGVRGDCGAPERGDFVLVDSPRSPKMPLVKIVFGVPGDEFRLKETEGGHNLIINGKIAKNSEGKPYFFTGKRKQMLALYEGPIPANTYLILGNDPNGSIDSTRIGLVDKGEFVGMAKRTN